MPEILQFAHGILTIGGQPITSPVSDRDPSPEEMPENPFASSEDATKTDTKTDAKADDAKADDAKADDAKADDTKAEAKTDDAKTDAK